MPDVDAESHLLHEESGVSEGNRSISEDPSSKQDISYHSRRIEKECAPQKTSIHQSRTTLIYVGVLLAIALFMYHFVNNDCMRNVG